MMGYLMMPGGVADFSKATISLWFRVPQASLDRAASQSLPDSAEYDINTYFPALAQTVPLVVFGSIERAITHYGDGTGAYPTSPSFIGIDCSGGIKTLAVHLAMSNSMTFVMTPMDSDGSGSYGEPQFLHTLQRNDAFYMSGYGDRPYWGGHLSQLVVTPDRWHHALISFDLTNSAVMNYSTAPESAPPYPPAISVPPGGPTFMWAFDDNDKTDYSLSPSCAQVYNEVPPTSIVVPAAPVPFKQITTNNLIDVMGGAWAFIATWPSISIKSSGNPIGVPASAMFVDSVYKVEMAEFQMWTGVTLDTSVVSNRRAFIDAKGKPVDPKIAADFLGKPAVMFHRSGDWIHGNNKGSASNFNPVGTIKKYTPDPSLYGPQTPGS